MNTECLILKDVKGENNTMNLKPGEGKKRGGKSVTCSLLLQSREGRGGGRLEGTRGPETDEASACRGSAPEGSRRGVGITALSGLILWYQEGSFQVINLFC